MSYFQVCPGGHTPGHQVLEVKLAEAGVIVVSGDLYHLRECRDFRQVPAFNTSRADTLASIDRIETILKNTHGRLIIRKCTVDTAPLASAPDGIVSEIANDPHSFRIADAPGVDAGRLESK